MARGRECDFSSGLMLIMFQMVCLSQAPVYSVTDAALPVFPVTALCISCELSLPLLLTC